jgi:hypothetical protein
MGAADQPLIRPGAAWNLRRAGNYALKIRQVHVCVIGFWFLHGLTAGGPLG